MNSDDKNEKTERRVLPVGNLQISCSSYGCSLIQHSSENEKKRQVCEYDAPHFQDVVIFGIRSKFRVTPLGVKTLGEITPKDVTLNKVKRRQGFDETSR